MTRNDFIRPGLMYDEYAQWRDIFEPTVLDPCPKCTRNEYTISGTCLTCKRIREATSLFHNLCLTIGHILWLEVDDSSKRFMMMELK